MKKERGVVGDARDREIAERRAKLLQALKESARFRQLLRDAAAQLRDDAAKLEGEDEAPRRRLLLESASRMERYAADMEGDDDADSQPPRSD